LAIESSNEQVELGEAPVSETQVSPVQAPVSEAPTALVEEAVPALSTAPVKSDTSVASEKEEKQKHVSRVANPLWSDDIAFDDFLIKEPEAPVMETPPPIKFDDQPMMAEQAELPKIDLGQLVQNIKQVVEEPKPAAIDNPFEMKKIEV
ncbi:MAG: hypothetical protein ACO3LE_03950, partial [Bdellovibrionota bacterium]